MKKISLFILLSCLWMAGCKKDEDSSTTPTTPTPSAYYISCDIDGVHYAFTDKKDGYSITPFTGHVQQANPPQNKGVYNTLIAINPTQPVSSFQFYKYPLIYTGSLPGLASFQNFFKTGSVGYTANGGPDEGVGFVYYDASGTVWDSFYALSQTGTFKITSSTARDAGGINYMDVQGTFSCVIATSNGVGGSKNVTNGKFFVTFQRQE